MNVINFLPRRRLLSVMLVAGFLGACSGGSTGDSTAGGTTTGGTTTGGVIREDDPNANTPSSIIPIVGEIGTMADTGLRYLYGTQEQVDSVSPDFIEAQWSHMQTCLEIPAGSALVTLVNGKVSPESVEDDVLRHVDGQIKASSHIDATGVSIQVSDEDFNGTLGNEGDYLRGIIGRYLWLSEGLPERDYPYECANGE